MESVKKEYKHHYKQYMYVSMCALFPYLQVDDIVAQFIDKIIQF